MAVGVCHPRGYRAGTAAAGMKAGGAADLALVVSDTPGLRRRRVHAELASSPRRCRQPRPDRAPASPAPIVTNSGLANACTGEGGLADAWEMVDTAATALEIARGQVLVASTGVIGPRLPMPAVDRRDRPGRRRAFARRRRRRGRGHPHHRRVRQGVGRRSSTIGGAEVRRRRDGQGGGHDPARHGDDARPGHHRRRGHPAAAAAVLTDAMAESFNAISVDGCTSTNDCVFLLANGAGGATRDRRGDRGADRSRRRGVARSRQAGRARRRGRDPRLHLRRLGRARRRPGRYRRPRGRRERAGEVRAARRRPQLGPDAGRPRRQRRGARPRPDRGRRRRRRASSRAGSASSAPRAPPARRSHSPTWPSRSTSAWAARATPA